MDFSWAVWGGCSLIIGGAALCVLDVDCYAAGQERSLGSQMSATVFDGSWMTAWVSIAAGSHLACHVSPGYATLIVALAILLMHPVRSFLRPGR